MNAGRAVAVLLLVAGGLALLIAPARELRRALLVERALAALGSALDAHAARSGTFPDEALLSGGELATRLVRDGDLAGIPSNPDTGRPFGSVDLETDLVFYEVLRGGRGYRIEVLDADGVGVAAVHIGTADATRGR